MKTEIIPYQRLTPLPTTATEATNSFSSILKITNLIYPIAFLLAKISIASGMIPFGIAFYSAVEKIKLNRFMLFSSIILGTMFSGNIESTILVSSSLLLTIVLIHAFKLNSFSKTSRFALTALISTIVPELIINFNSPSILQDFIKTSLKGFAVFSLTFIFSTALSSFKNGHLIKKINNEQMLGITITLILAISSLSSITIWDLNIKNIFFILLLLIIGYVEGSGASAATAVSMGLVSSISDSMQILSTSRLAICALLSGVLRPLGKAGVIIGFIAGYTVFTIYFPDNYSPTTTFLSQLLEIGIPIAIFSLIPQTVFNLITNRFCANTTEISDTKIHSSKIKDLTIEKLNRFSSAFKELSKTFGDNTENNVTSTIYNGELTTLFDRVADCVCKDCSLCSYCWDKNFYNTYQVTFNIFEHLEDNGRIVLEDLPQNFLNSCERTSNFIDAVNNTYEVFKVNLIWKNRIGESKGLFSKQLEGLSGMISNLCTELSQNIDFKRELEELLTERLTSLGLRLSDCFVYETPKGKTEINIIHKGCDGKKYCSSIIEKAVSSVTGKKFVKEFFSCKNKSTSETCHLKLLEAQQFAILTGVSRAGKDSSNISGDNYTFLNCTDGKYCIALSDGMGSGITASKQSKSAINLLEQFIESGFDNKTTLNLINSILALNSPEDSFTTLDLSIVDLYSGEVEFIKIGSVPTFIKKLNSIETIRSYSLPAGVMTELNPDFLKTQLSVGDLIIMLSDGILDSYKYNSTCKSTEEECFVQFLQSVKTLNPQEMADEIMESACNNVNSIPQDDMLVMVAKIWERV